MDKVKLNVSIPPSLTPYKVERSETDTFIFVENGYIGKGSFGMVYQAVSCKTGDIVAVKLIKEKAKVSKDEVESEIDAFKQITKICGTDIVCYRDHYIVDGRYRIVLDYIKGGYDLSKYMKVVPLKSSKNWVGREDRDDFAKELVLSIDKLHNETFVTHQDLKEDNLLWDFERDRPRITDLGNLCSYDNDCKSDPKEICKGECGYIGTFYTTPPENRKNVDDYVITPPIVFNQSKAHDIWSVGVIILNWYGYDERAGSGLSLYKNTPEQIKEKIGRLPNKFGRDILELLLENDPLKRLENWAKCVKMAENAVPLDFLTDKYLKLKKKITQLTSEQVQAKANCVIYTQATMTNSLPQIEGALLQHSAVELITLATHYKISLNLPISQVVKLIAKQISVNH